MNDEISWRDIYGPDELADKLQDASIGVAKKSGNYDLAAMLLHASEAIRDLETEREALQRAGGSLIRQLMARRESLTS